MKKILFPLLVISFSCNRPAVERNVEDKNKVTEYQSLIQGHWKFHADTNYIFAVNGSKALFIAPGRTENDSVDLSLSDKNFNPGGAYNKAAEMMAKRPFVYLRTKKKKSGENKIRKRCYAIIVLDQQELKLMETETGSILEYHK